MDPESAPIGLVEVDAGGRIVGVNQMAARVLGRGPEALEGVLLRSCFAPDAAWDDGDGAASMVRDARTAGEGRSVDVAFGPADETGVRWVGVIEVVARDALREEMDRLRGALARAEKERSRAESLGSEIAAAGATEIVGASASVLRMLEMVDRVAPSTATVLIHGESGSGKELVARTIHARSPRGARPMVALNCAAIPENLVESELFGHERGAFTGADRQRIGKFELADESTLFLDEVAELSLAAQAKLLRVLQERAFTRVGGAETIQTDVRLIAATHRDLAMRVRRGMFREDLFYRLNVFRIDVPPVRERPEDIAALAAFLHEKHARRLARPVLPISDRSVRRMLAYRWPGNVRELENAVERATVLATGSELEVEIPDTPELTAEGSATDASARDTSAVPRDVLLGLTIDQLQRLQIMHALETSAYKVFGADGAASKLGMNPQTLLSRMDKLGVPRPRAARRALRGDADSGGASS